MARLNLKPAASGMSHHSFDVSTIASLDFGELLPVRCIETVKKDHFTQVQANGIIRLSPQVFPAYGKCFVKSAAFFVPEYQLFEASDAFHANMSTWKGNSVHLPYFNSNSLNNLFYIGNYSTDTAQVAYNNLDASTVPSWDTYDFVHLTNNPFLFHYHKLNRHGEHLYKIIKSLGYEFSSYSYVTNGTITDVLATGQLEYNALPLLAYAKVWCDFFLNPQFYNNHPIVSLLNAIQFGKDYTYNGLSCFVASTGEITMSGIAIILEQILLPHQGGMYLDAWNSPNSPDGVSPVNSMVTANPSGLISPYVVHPTESTVIDNVSSDSYANYSSTGTPANDIKYLSAVGLRILQQFDKFVRRRGLSGNKAVERIYSMFGIKSDFFSSHYCHKIFDSASRIDFNPVLSNSNTTSSIPGQSGTSLGAYAGYASSGLNFSFEHKCDSFGYIICVTWLQVVPMLLRGVDPTVLRKYPFDFYTPEYDGQTVRAIPHCEVSYAKSGLTNSTYSNTSKQIYGYTNLYDDYRYMKDNIIGDFITSANARNFLFGRDISVFYQNGGTPKPQTTVIHYYDNWLSGYDVDMTDPFQILQSNGDRFYLQLDFHIEADRPIKSESDAINLNGEGDLSFSMNGNSLS